MRIPASILLMLGTTWLALGGEVAAQSTATYEVTFESSWSATTHPDGFPSNPHFSGLIGGTHDATATFWAEGETASTGIKNMAETGSKSALGSEVDIAIKRGSAEAMLSGGGISPSPGVRRLTFSLSEAYPLVTLVSMLAPSPDWFVGVGGLRLLEQGAWVDTLVVDLFTYDAGTDSGTTYTAANQATNPPQPIAKIETVPFLVNAEVPPVGTFTFILQSVEEPTAVEEPLSDLPETHLLSAAYPNPFTPQTVFTLIVRRSQHVRLALYDLTGRRVDMLFEGFLQAGTPHRFTIQGNDLPSGVYVYRVVGEGFSDSRAVVLMR